MSHVRPIYLGLLAILIAAYFADAEELTFGELNCAITIPSGWTKWPVDHTNYHALIKSQDELKSVIFSVRPAINSGWAFVDEQFARELRESFVASGATLKSARRLSISGVPAYEFAGEMPFQGKKVSLVSRVVIAAGQAYKLNAMYLEGDALSDRELQQCLDSFRFLKPVTSPHSTMLPKTIFGALAGASLILLALTLQYGLTRTSSKRLSLNLVAWALLFAAHAISYLVNP
jgi:hypothetical protein